MKFGVLFDLDGTLLNTIEDLTDAVNYALAQYGCPPRTVEQVRKAIGNGAKKLIERSLPGLDTDPDVDAVLRTYQAYYKDHCQIKTRPYDGISEMLATLEYPVAVVSNKPDAPTKLLCAQLFPGVYARGEGEGLARKPAPDMLLHAMKQLGVDTCVYIGDSEADIEAARNTQVPCISVLWGFRDKEELKKAGAQYFCEKPDQLSAIIKEIIEKNGQ